MKDDEQAQLPLYTVEAQHSTQRLADYIHDRIDEVASLILEHGGVLFRGFRVAGAADYREFIEGLGARPMAYTNRSTPRTRVLGDVFTATEYPAQLEIPLHCENAYQRTWPMWLSLCCITPASAGGYTPVANMGRVTAAIPPATLERFARRGVKYIRHYREHIDLPWEEVFQTHDRQELARFCAANDIHHEWLEREILRTEHICQGVAVHPQTGATVFFNQAHLFHVSSLGHKAAEDVIRIFGRDRLPRDARFGDGTDIGAEDLAAVRGAFASAARDLRWRPGDVVILDNMQFAHGRRSYVGERRVLAALLNPH